MIFLVCKCVVVNATSAVKHFVSFFSQVKSVWDVVGIYVSVFTMWRGRIDLNLAISFCYCASIFSWAYSFSQGSVLLLRAGDQLTEQQPLSMLLNLLFPSTMSGASCNKRTRDNGQWHSCRQRNIIITHSFSAFSSKIVHDVVCMSFYQKVFTLKSWWDSADKSIGYLFANTLPNALHYWRMAIVQLFWYPIDSAIWRICKDCQKT